MKPDDCYAGLMVSAKLDGHTFEAQVTGMLGSQALLSPMQIEDWMAGYVLHIEGEMLIPVLAQFCELSDGALECNGHPAGPFDKIGETVYCDGSCRKGQGDVGKVNVGMQCRHCKHTYLFKGVDAERYQQWKNGALIQNVLPELNDAERELFISATCGKCFDKMFGEG